MISDLAQFFTIYFRDTWYLLQQRTPFGNFSYAQMYIIGPLVVILGIAIFKGFVGLLYDKGSTNNAFKRGEKK